MKLKLPKSSTPILLLALGMVVAYALFVYLPLSRSIASAQDSLQLKRSLVLQEASLVAQIERYENELADVQQYTQRWQEVPNPNFHLSQMLGEISQQAKLSGADALRLEPGQLTMMETMQRIPVRLGCTGTFQEIHDLVSRIEELPHQIWVQQIELAPKDDLQKLLNCEIEFEAFIVSAKNSH